MDIALVKPGRIVVGVSESLGGLAALRRAVAMAREDGRQLVAVLAWQPPGGEMAYRQAPCPPLAEIWEQQATLRLMDAFDAALGGFPPDVDLEPRVERFPAADALCAIADRPDDIVVIGAGDRGPARRLLHGSVRRRVLARAGCPVLAVRPPAVPRGARRALRHARPTDIAPGGFKLA